MERSSTRYVPTFRPDKEPLRVAILILATYYERYLFRRLTSLLTSEAGAVGARRSGNRARSFSPSANLICH